MEKRYDRLEEIVIGVKKNIDTIEEVQKFNPHHDSRGRFTSGGGGGVAGAKLGDTVDWKGKPHVIVGDSGGENGQLKLRPASRFGGDADFDGGGDSFDDVHIDRYQLGNTGKGGAGGGMSHAERDAKEKYGMTMQQMRDAVANDPEANKIASEMLNTQMNAGINHMTFDEVAVLAYAQVHGKKSNGSSNSGSLAGKNVYAKDENGVLRRVQPDYVKQVESKIQHHKEKLERLMDKHGPGGNSDRRTDIERTKKQLKEYEAEYKGFVVKD